MIKWKLPTVGLAILTFLLVDACHLAVDVAGEVPIDFPAWLSGGYVVESENGTLYTDHLQPDSTETYLIHLENFEMEQVRYRVSISNVPAGWMFFLDNGAKTDIVDIESGQSKALNLNVKAPSSGTAEVTINVSEEESSDFWTFALKLICEEGPLLLSTDAESYILGRDTPAVMNLTLWNIGTSVLNITMEMGGITVSDEPIEDAWTVSFSKRTFFLAPGLLTNVLGTVLAPVGEPVGSQKVSTVSATVEGISRPFTSMDVTFKVSTIYDLRADVAPFDYQEANPGGSVQFTLTLDNRAYDTDYVLVSEYETPTNWDVGWNDTIDPTSFAISISPRSSRDFHPVVFLPLNAVAGRHEVILKVKGSGDLLDIALPIEVARKDSFEASVILPAGEDMYRLTVGPNSVPFKVVNRGNFYDSAKFVLESRPEWAPMYFSEVVVGAGAEVMELQTGTVNISGYSNNRFLFPDGLEEVRVSFDPFQTATVVISTDVSLDSPAHKGVAGITYIYGALMKQQFLQMSLKLLLVDIAILDNDADGVPDLDLDPPPDYKVGDRIRFSWTLRNDYPYPTTSDLKWRIELGGSQGVVLLSGDVGTIGPGETKHFNVSWKADKSTDLYNYAYLKVYGPAYSSEDQYPSARTDQVVYIEGGKGPPDWGLMILFAGFMIFLIIAFVAFYIWVRMDLKRKEEEEKRKYEAVYGTTSRKTLKGSAPERRTPLGPAKRERLGPAKGKGADEGARGSEGKGKDRRHKASKMDLSAGPAPILEEYETPADESPKDGSEATEEGPRMGEPLEEIPSGEDAIPKEEGTAGTDGNSPPEEGTKDQEEGTVAEGVGPPEEKEPTKVPERPKDAPRSKKPGRSKGRQ